MGLPSSPPHVWIQLHQQGQETHISGPVFHRFIETPRLEGTSKITKSNSPLISTRISQRSHFPIFFQGSFLSRSPLAIFLPISFCKSFFLTAPPEQKSRKKKKKASRTRAQSSQHVSLQSPISFSKFQPLQSKKSPISPPSLSPRLSDPSSPSLSSQIFVELFQQLFPWPLLYLQHCVHICFPLCLLFPAAGSRVLNHCSALRLPDADFILPSMLRLDRYPKAVCKLLCLFFSFPLLPFGRRASLAQDPCSDTWLLAACSPGTDALRAAPR